MEHKHTPGPWRVGRHFTDDEGYREIAIEATVRGVECVPASVALQFVNCGGMQEANARLIAAAPELLEALTWAADNPDDSAYWIKQARAAIAKATGATHE
ncbi:hypothetical protein JQS35_11170 [Alcaligenes faecalis subsp. faecalis]|uniref:hypothetical protein n=1 Tax=Alcaligenes faecalis TaxID=511 RepID=UPI001F44E19B|nr:hypothetical protein [Alcaligenes faecalis]MBW4789160.1 hypothetical protein [Alcaligenes faecalis subsp. faecalis]